MRLVDAYNLLDRHTEVGKVGKKIIGYVTVENIVNAPTVDAEPVRHGHWIGDKCSACGEERAWYGCNPHWCPDCGAKMDEEDKT